MPRKPPAGAVSLPDGTWAAFGQMTGRDFRFLASLGNLADTEDPAAVTGLLDLIERRCTASSVPDVIDLPLASLMALAAKWLGTEEESALPPESAPR